MANDITHDDSVESVLFAQGDYVGLFRRFEILIVDGIVLLLAWFLLVELWYVVIDPISEPYYESVWSCIGLTYAYLTILKSSRLGTLGFRLTGVRIVDHKGQPPSLLRMTFRILLWIAGPINPIIDLIWLGGDRHRQTLRDKFAGTYVVNRGATPVGRGKRKAAYYNFLGATFIFWEIEPAE